MRALAGHQHSLANCWVCFEKGVDERIWAFCLLIVKEIDERGSSRGLIVVSRPKFVDPTSITSWSLDECNDLFNRSRVIQNDYHFFWSFAIIGLVSGWFGVFTLRALGYEGTINEVKSLRNLRSKKYHRAWKETEIDTCEVLICSKEVLTLDVKN